VVADLPTAMLDRETLVGHITGAEQIEAVGRRRARGVRSEREVLRVEHISLPGVVEDVSLRLLGGEVLGIAGLVGAGRTELVRLIFGADRRAAGRIFVCGREVRVKNPRQALDAGLALLPEDRRTQGAILNFSIRKNMTLAVLPRFRLAAPLPLPVRAREAAAARRLIDRLAIAARHEEQPVEKLSGGTQQKVVLAKWLARGADVFIFDEPTHGIDVEAKEEFYELMQELAEEGKGVIFISSEFSELVLVSHRVLVMHEGRLVGELDGDEISERSIIERCYAAPGSPAA
jgi:ribose transport system ATP-binding protein